LLYVGEEGLEGVDGTFVGLGGITGFCIREGFGGKGGRGVFCESPVVCLLIGFPIVAGE
jgi:hypothetical protein